MKILFKLFSSSVLAIMIIFTLGCEGPSGEDGKTGPQGPSGNNANDQCKVCHNQTNHKLKVSQYNLSVHASGKSLAIAGSNNECARCHSHEGFVETNFTGRNTTVTDLLIATRIGCSTCHTSHISYDTLADGKDYALRVTDAIKMIIAKDSAAIDFGSSNNGCAYCHQPLYGKPVANTDGKFKVANSMFGPHHGPQSTILFGIGAYEVPGAKYPAPSSSAHFKNGACVACHIGKATGETGAHTFTANIANCTSCHQNATNFNINGVQTEVETLLSELESKLKSLKMLKSDGTIYPGTYPINQAGAYYNYILIKDDRSLGIHNPDYVKAVLKNSINSLN